MTLTEWKSIDITQIIMSELKARQEQLKNELASSAGVDPLYDRWRAGVIAGYSDLLNIELDEPEENS